MSLIFDKTLLLASFLLRALKPATPKITEARIAKMLIIITLPLMDCRNPTLSDACF